MSESPLPTGRRSHVRMSDRTIVLVGLMGVGKTTIGRRLAARLRLGFVDTDREIERAAGMTIAEIFERFGEAHFRDGERRVIQRLLAGRRTVMATGGGAFMNETTRALILQRATAVWLDADLDVLAERVSRRHGTRPLLADGNPREVLERLAAVRNPVYALAPIHIRSEPLPHEATVTAIMRALRR
jgi:shikimate kinase